jgi:hypothetical protein
MIRIITINGIITKQQANQYPIKYNFAKTKKEVI